MLVSSGSAIQEPNFHSIEEIVDHHTGSHRAEARVRTSPAEVTSPTATRSPFFPYAPLESVSQPVGCRFADRIPAAPGSHLSGSSVAMRVSPFPTPAASSRARCEPRPRSFVSSPTSAAKKPFASLRASPFNTKPASPSHMLASTSRLPEAPSADPPSSLSQTLSLCSRHLSPSTSAGHSSASD